MRKTKSFQSLPSDESTASSPKISLTSVMDTPSDVNFEIGSGFDLIEDAKNTHRSPVEVEQYPPTITITMLTALNKQRLAILHDPSHPSHHAQCFFSNKHNINHHTQKPALVPHTPV